MNPRFALIASQQQLRIIQEALDRQKMLLRTLDEGEDQLAIAKRVLLGLEAVITMLEVQHLLIVDDAQGSLPVTRH